METSLNFRELLKTRTLESHRELESVSRVMKPDFTLHEFKTLVRQWAEFYFVLEAMIDENQARFPEIFDFMATRRKLPLLTQDLGALGVQTDVTEMNEIRRFLTPIFGSRAKLWGALYVVEGSTLGAQVITRHLSNQFALSPETGLRFYHGYGERTGPFWREFVQRLENLDLTPDEIDDGVEAARDLFKFFGRFKVEEPI